MYESGRGVAGEHELEMIVEKLAKLPADVCESQRIALELA